MGRLLHCSSVTSRTSFTSRVAKQITIGAKLVRDAFDPVYGFGYETARKHMTTLLQLVQKSIGERGGNQRDSGLDQCAGAGAFTHLLKFWRQ
jgi:hypothetical protein